MEKELKQRIDYLESLVKDIFGKFHGGDVAQHDAGYKPAEDKSFDATQAAAANDKTGTADAQS